MQTFDNFIVGESNKRAHYLAKAIVCYGNSGIERLFIYGESGVGKTHLLKAVEREAVSLCGEDKVMYKRAGDFVDELMFYLKKGDVDGFRVKYLGFDYLLIDDAEILEGKEMTQREIVGILDFCPGTKVIVASCCVLRMFGKLDGRLRSGVVAKIEAIDIDLKRKILACELERYKLRLGVEDVERLAAGLGGNIFVLKGAVKALALSGSGDISKILEDYQ